MYYKMRVIMHKSRRYKGFESFYNHDAADL